jgi:serine/threonine protein kinase
MSTGEGEVSPRSVSRSVPHVRTPRINPFKSPEQMNVTVSNASFPAFTADNALFFYRHGDLTIIERNDWDSIKMFVEGTTFSSAIRCATIALGISAGYTTFYLDIIIHAGPSRDPIGSFKKISAGTHGVVYLLTFFDVVLKYYNEQNIMFMELAIYELIRKAYKSPEDLGLPFLRGHGNSYILIPNYTRVLKHKESDEIYYKLAKSIYNLHVLGIVHRDIKFSNVMVYEGTNPILLDFGLSTWKVATTHRPPGTSIQTMWFRAPEVANDRDREYPTDYASDWWSYGVILTSKEKMLLTPMTNDELVRDLDKLFANGDVPDLNKKYKQFLHKNPRERMTGAEFLGLPPITPELMQKSIPVASNVFTIKIATLPLITDSWTEYFTAVDYLYYVSESEANDLASIVIGGKDIEFDAARYFSLLEGNILRLNTFSILAMKYPLDQIVFPCFVLSLEGVHFPHTDQAKWVENYFIRGENGTYPDIEKHYFDLLPVANSFTKGLKTMGYVNVVE